MANNNSVDEYLVYLRENARELRKLGKEWGMTEEEIDCCVNEALSLTENKEDLKKSPKNIARTMWQYFRGLIKFLFISGFILIGLIGALVITTSYHEPTQKLVMGVITAHSYEIMRFARLVAIPLHGMFNISRYHHEECLINNPWFVEQAPDCNICRNFKMIKSFNASDFCQIRFGSYAQTMKPVQIKNALKQNVTYTDLRLMYNTLDDNLYASPHQFTSNDPRIQSLDNLFNEDRSKELTAMENLHLHWNSLTVKASAGLRTLFPRPHFLPAESEVLLWKHVLIDGPNATTYRLPSISNCPLNIYSQGSGHRRVLIRPAGECKDVCTSMLVFMDPGDTLLFNRDMWHAYLATNGNETSVGYVIGVMS